MVNTILYISNTSIAWELFRNVKVCSPTSESGIWVWVPEICVLENLQGHSDVKGYLSMI